MIDKVTIAAENCWISECQDIRRDMGSIIKEAYLRGFKRGAEKVRDGMNKQKKTNFGKIHSMNVEELAHWLGRACPNGRFAKEDETESPCKKFDTCANCWLDWLKGEIEEQ